MTTRSILVTVELRGDAGIPDRQAIEEINEALAASGRHPLQVRQATTYQVSALVPPSPVVVERRCDCELRNRQWNGHGKCLTCGGGYTVAVAPQWPRGIKPAPEWTPPEDNSRLPVGRKPRRKP